MEAGYACASLAPLRPALGVYKTDHQPAVLISGKLEDTTAHSGFVEGAFFLVIRQSTKLVWGIQQVVTFTGKTITKNQALCQPP